MNWEIIRKQDIVISILVPVYNAEQTILKALNSLPGPCIFSLEIIIQDNCSTDQSLAIIHDFKLKNPSLNICIESIRDSGQSQALNLAFKRSKGHLIGILNADDYYAPDIFQILAEHMKEQYTIEEISRLFIFGNLTIQEKRFKRVLSPKEFSLSSIEKWWRSDSYPLNPISYFYGRKLQEDNFYVESNYYDMDYVFLYGVLLAKPASCLSYINKTLGTFTISGDNKTSKVFKSIFKNFWFIKKNHLTMILKSKNVAQKTIYFITMFIQLTLLQTKQFLAQLRSALFKIP